MIKPQKIVLNKAINIEAIQYYITENDTFLEYTWYENNEAQLYGWRDIEDIHDKCLVLFYPKGKRPNLSYPRNN